MSLDYLKMTYHFTKDSLQRQNGTNIQEWLHHPKTVLLLFNEQGQYLFDNETYQPVNARQSLSKNMCLNDSCIIHFLAYHETQPWFCLQISQEHTESILQNMNLPQNTEWHNLRDNLSILYEPLASILAFAKALLHWHENYQYCGRCGQKLLTQQAGHEKFCLACDKTFYPRTDAAIIVSVIHDDHLLLGRQSHWKKNHYSVLAGFVEPGESLEHAVVREVFEETNVQVKNPDYIASQPWPFPHSLMIGFTVHACHNHIQCNDNELENAFWISRDECQSQLQNKQLSIPPQETLSGLLIRHWLNQTN